MLWSLPNQIQDGGGGRPVPGLPYLAYIRTTMHIYARTELALPGSSHLRQLLSLCRLDLHILGFPHAAAFLTSICNAERCSLPCFQLHIEPPNCPAPFPTLVLCAEPKVPGVTFPRHSPFGLRCLVEFGDFEPHRCTGVTWVDRQGRTGSALVFLPPELPGRKKLSLFPSGSDLLPCGPSPICIFHNDSGFSKIHTREGGDSYRIFRPQKKSHVRVCAARLSPPPTLLYHLPKWIALQEHKPLTSLSRWGHQTQARFF